MSIQACHVHRLMWGIGNQALLAAITAAQLGDTVGEEGNCIVNDLST